MAAAARSFGRDALEPLTREEEVGMFRPEVVLSGKGGSNHIFGELSRITAAGFVPRMARGRGSSFPFCGPQESASASSGR